MLEFPDEKLLNHPSHSLRMKTRSFTAFRTTTAVSSLGVPGIIVILRSEATKDLVLKNSVSRLQ